MNACKLNSRLGTADALRALASAQDGKDEAAFLEAVADGVMEYFPPLDPGEIRTHQDETREKIDRIFREGNEADERRKLAVDGYIATLPDRERSLLSGLWKAAGRIYNSADLS